MGIFNVKSLRFKLILASILVELVMLGVLLSNSLRLLNQAIQHQTQTRIEEITPLLNAALSSRLFERDYVALKAMIENLVDNPREGLSYIVVYDDSGRVYAQAGDLDIAGPPPQTSSIAELAKDAVFHTEIPLHLSGEAIGKVKFGLSLSSFLQSREAILHQGLLVAGVEVGLTFLLLGVLGYWLTRHIGYLVAGTRSIIAGDYAIRLPTRSGDEVGQLAANFNEMTRTICDRVAALNQSQEALKENKAELEAILTSVADAVVFTDPEKHILMVNPAFEAMFGYTLGELQGATQELLYANRAEFLEQTGIANAPHDKDAHTPSKCTYRRKDGGFFRGETLRTAARDVDGNLIGHVASIREVTERERLEEALRESETRFRLLAENSRDIICLHAPDGHLLYISPSVKVLLGYTPEELVGTDPYDFVHPDDVKTIRDNLHQPALRGFPSSLRTFRVRRKSGEYAWFEALTQPILDADGRVVQLQSSYREVSERVFYERELESHARELESQKFALDQHAIVSIADTSGKITYVNEKFTEISEYSRDELLGQDHRILNSGHHPTSFFKKMWETISRGQVWHGEIRNRKKSGNFYWVYTSIVPFLDLKGRPYQYISIRTDITVRKQAEIDLTQARDEAEAANRAKSEFLARMSHELRTPLNAILGFSQLLNSDPTEPLSESQQETMQHILKAGWHLLELINEVLDLSRIEAGRLRLTLENVKIIPLLGECLELIRPAAAERNIQVTADISPCQEHEVHADSVRLKQVLLNLLSNAVKYNRVGGSIRLSCKELPDRRIRVSVTDTGAGIPSDKRGMLFEAFNRLDADKTHVQGTGIGLSISKRLIELMGGSICVESTVGTGSTFWIDVLPQNAVTTLESAEKSMAVPKLTTPEPSRFALLYIEDNVANLKLVQQIVRAHMPEVRLISASDGAQGIDLARTVHPDAMLIDINLPDMDGYEILARLRTDVETSEIPAIALSANAMPEDIATSRSAGFDGYITKPVDIQQLVAAIRSVFPA